MKTTRKLKLFLFVCLLLAACAPQTPIAVYVTPTPQASLVQTTLEAEETLVKPTEVSAVSHLGFTLTSMQTGPTIEPHPTVTWSGPVIGPGYVLPATSTPRPTTPPPTVEGQPTSQPSNGVTLPGGLPDLDPSRIGVQIDSNLQQSDWDAAMTDVGSDKLGTKWIKLQLPWRDMQPDGPGEVNNYFKRIVLYLQDAKRRQLNVLVSVAKAPAWARSTHDQDGPPDKPQDYADFLTLLLSQVGPSIDAIEVWNEPNLIREWDSGSGLPFNGIGYMQLFKAAYTAIRAYSPSIQIVTAGLAPTGNSAGSVDDRTYLKQMYANGLGNYRDIAVGIHPYSWANSPDSTCCSNQGWDDDPHFFFADNIRDYRQIMVNNGHSDMKMWVTEFGWATWDGFPGQPPKGSEWMSRVSKWDQANYTIRAFQIGQQTPYIGPMILWNLDFAALPGLIANRDERIAYSIVIPGKSGQLDPNSKNRTERPLFWMIYDAVRPNVHLDKYD